MIGFETLRDIEHDIRRMLDNSGIMYRLFSRCKTKESLEHKIIKSHGKYSKDGKKIQDVLGLRIIFYFLEDVAIIKDFLMKEYKTDTYVDKSDSEADLKDIELPANLKYENIFQPQRLNLIFRMNDMRTEMFIKDVYNADFTDASYADLIDNTFEVQLRSVLSEGWHEVEHDLRYKCKEAQMWNYCQTESRYMNAIYGSLESNEMSLTMIFDRMAYLNYQKHDWEDMLRNHFRIRLNAYKSLSTEICDILNSDTRLAKNILTIPRATLHSCLLKFASPYPLNYDNIVFLVNRLLEDDSCQEIRNFEPEIISKKLDAFLYSKR